MTSGSLVTCIVPVWNGERYVAQALDSIFAQTHRALEIIVVDDGSTDRTRSIVAADGRAIQLIGQENAGPVVARNRAIEAANGDLIAFLDHDDLWAPSKIAWQVAAFAEEPDLAACIGHVQEFHEDEAGRCVNRGAPVAGNITSALMVARRAIDRVGPFDAALRHADVSDWMLRARLVGCREAVLPDIVAYKRRHDSNRSQIHNDRSRREYLGVFKAHLDRTRKASAVSPA